MKTDDLVGGCIFPLLSESAVFNFHSCITILKAQGKEERLNPKKRWENKH